MGGKCVGVWVLLVGVEDSLAVGIGVLGGCSSLVVQTAGVCWGNRGSWEVGVESVGDLVGVAFFFWLWWFPWVDEAGDRRGGREVGGSLLVASTLVDIAVSRGLVWVVMVRGWIGEFSGVLGLLVRGRLLSSSRYCVVGGIAFSR